MLLICVSSGLFWYGKQQIDKQLPQYQYEQVKIDERHPLNNLVPNPACSIKISLQYIKTPHNEASDLINKTISKKLFDKENDLEKQSKVFAKQYRDRYIADIAPLYAQEEAGSHVEGWYNYSYKADGKFANGCFGVLNYLIQTNEYEGGAHSIPMCIYLNFDKNSGALLTADSIYAEGYEKKLNELLLDALMKKLHISKIQELKKLGYLSTTSIYPPDNFLLKEEGILYYYNVYEIAPYALGATQLTISYSDLDDILRDDFKDKYSDSSIKRVINYYSKEK